MLLVIAECFYTVNFYKKKAYSHVVMLKPREIIWARCCGKSGRERHT